MTVEKIKASSMNRAMLKAKKIFKDDAMILESKNIVLDGKNYYEILVSGTRVSNEDSEKKDSVRENAQQVLNIVNKINRNTTQKTSTEKTRKTTNYPVDDRFKFLLDDEYDIISSLDNKKLEVYKKLRKKEISSDISYSIIEELFNIGFDNKEERNAIIEKIIRDNLNVSGNLYGNSYEQRIVSLIGTTGVGKTTTLAKIVSEALLSYNKKVVVFTFDNYKKSTLLQLKVHASILKVPFEIIKSRDDLENKLIKYSSYDLILLDMEGVDVFDEAQLNELEHLLSMPPRIEKHLTIPVNLRQYDQENLFKKFKRFNPDYLLYTRLDETDLYAPILNMNLKTDTPISYLTTGPHITGDILLANKSKIARLIMN
jgi:flagellar biosynthesis protein FlhF